VIKSIEGGPSTSNADFMMTTLLPRGFVMAQRTTTMLPLSADKVSSERTLSSTPALYAYGVNYVEMVRSLADNASDVLTVWMYTFAVDVMHI